MNFSRVPHRLQNLLAFGTWRLAPTSTWLGGKIFGKTPACSAFLAKYSVFYQIFGQNFLNRIFGSAKWKKAVRWNTRCWTPVRGRPRVRGSAGEKHLWSAISLSFFISFNAAGGGAAALEGRRRPAAAANLVKNILTMFGSKRQQLNGQTLDPDEIPNEVAPPPNPN